ncbi:hypothetical protein CH063_16152, partial [Colletotrichum higginsianum]
MTASTSFWSFRYGCVETTVLRAALMVMRPREVAPRPRYWLMVMASAVGGTLSVVVVVAALHARRVLQLARDAVGALDLLKEPGPRVVSDPQQTKTREERTTEAFNSQGPDVGRGLGQDAAPLLQVGVLLGGVGADVGGVEVVELHVW